MVKKKIKTRVIYREATPKTFDTSKVKSEIEELESKRQKAVEGKKGFRKFLAGAGYNKAIGEKRDLLRKSTQLQTIKQQTELERAKNELAKVKSERVDFGRVKGITIEDLYK